MKSLRILIADLPTLLHEIVGWFAARTTMKVSSSSPGRSQVKRELRHEPADVVVLGLAESEVPDICSQILDEFPGTTVVGLGADGRRTSLYVNDLGPAQLLDTVRGVSRANGRATGRRQSPTAREGER